MKKFILLSVVLLAVSVSVSARINPEDYGNIRVDTIWWEGPIYRHYSKMVHMRITNTGETKIEGVLGINDRYGSGIDSNGDTIYFDYPFGTLDISLMPQETKEYTFRFLPYHDFFPEGQTKNIAHLCLKAGYTDDEVYGIDIEFERTNRINSNSILNVSDIDYSLNGDVDYTIKENVATLSDNLPVIEWTYENLEDFPVFDICAMSLCTASYKQGEFVADSKIEGYIMFTGIDKGETITGTFVPESVLKEKQYYMLIMYYGLIIDDPFFGTTWHTIRYAKDAFVFKIELPTGIKEVKANDADKPIYTLGGVRITNTDNLPKGIYVRNGKKFVVK
jgi:hypothetical protein